MTGKTVLVTGSTDGIGRATALKLAALGAHVILHGRSAQRLQETAGELRNSTHSTIDTVEGDFASLAMVRACGEEVLERFPRIDVLIHNAGVFMEKRTLTLDGFETTFAINHLAPFLLTHLLVGLLRRSVPARIVVVSSTTHVGSPCDFDNLQGEKWYDGRKAYALSKLANALFTVELASRLHDSGVTANYLHPGAVATKLLSRGFAGIQGITVEEGAETSVYLASSPEVEGVTGRYFANRRTATPSPLTRNESVRRQLWEVSSRLTGIVA